MGQDNFQTWQNFAQVSIGVRKKIANPRAKFISNNFLQSSSWFLNVCAETPRWQSGGMMAGACRAMGYGCLSSLGRSSALGSSA